MCTYVTCLRALKLRIVGCNAVVFWRPLEDSEGLSSSQLRNQPRLVPSPFTHSCSAYYSILEIGAAAPFEMSVNIYQTIRRNISKRNHCHRWPCRNPGGQSPVSQRDGLSSSPDSAMWALWWTKPHWD
jgi:hypothetical protein